MAILANFPMLSQRDGDANAEDDCVPASIAAGLTWLTGVGYTARQVKDAAYGPAYTGGTAASQYVEYCANQGVALAPIDGDGNQLVAAVQSSLTAGHPCLITEPDPYLPPGSGWTHVCIAYSCDANDITVMDPWISEPVVKSTTLWASLFQFNEVWTMEKAMLTIDQAKNYFIASGDGSTWTCKNSFVVGHALLSFYCQVGGGQRAPLFGLTLLGLPRSNEISVPGHAGVVIQMFERGVACYDPQHVIDNPPGAGDVYMLHLDSLSSPAMQPLLALLGVNPATPAVNLSAAIAQFKNIEAAAATGLKGLGAS